MIHAKCGRTAKSGEDQEILQMFIDVEKTGLAAHRSTSPTYDAITPRNASNREVFGGVQTIGNRTIVMEYFGFVQSISYIILQRGFTVEHHAGTWNSNGTRACGSQEAIRSAGDGWRLGGPADWLLVDGGAIRLDHLADEVIETGSMHPI